jgi:hypothetical protein
MNVFKRGICQGFKIFKPLGGHIEPISIAGDNRYFRKFDPQFGTEFKDILVSCLGLQLSENSDIHCTTHAAFPPPRAARRDYYLSPRTILERADYNIIPPHFVLVFKSSNTPQFIRQCRFARRLARLRIAMSVDL